MTGYWQHPLFGDAILPPEWYLENTDPPATDAVEEPEEITEEPEEITEELFGQHLYTAGMPDVDLLIRTSGEMRLSNFLLYQCAYAEFVFPTVLWPDFDLKQYHQCIAEFQGRKRRFGKREE